jgi:hypothetical protein
VPRAANASFHALPSRSAYRKYVFRPDELGKGALLVFEGSLGLGRIHYVVAKIIMDAAHPKAMSKARVALYSNTETKTTSARYLADSARWSLVPSLLPKGKP